MRTDNLRIVKKLIITTRKIVLIRIIVKAKLISVLNYLENMFCFRCWQRDKLVGTVHLIVEKKYTLKYDKTVLLVGTTILFGVFGYIYFKAMTLSTKNK